MSEDKKLLALYEKSSRISSELIEAIDADDREKVKQLLDLMRENDEEIQKNNESKNRSV